MYIQLSHHPVYFSTSYAVLKWTFFKVRWKGGPHFFFLTFLTYTYCNSSGPFGKMTNFTLRGKIKMWGPFVCQGNYNGCGRNPIFMHLTLSFGREKNLPQWQFFLYVFLFAVLLAMNSTGGKVSLLFTLHSNCTHKSSQKSVRILATFYDIPTHF